MGKIKNTAIGYPFIAIMFSDDWQLDDVLCRLKSNYGNFLGSGPVFKVSDFTHYYEKEFGTELWKQLFVFEKPRELEHFSQVKVWTNEIEAKLGHSESGRLIRTINLDPGYFEPSKLVLYSTKNFSHRIYVGDGIFGEVTMIFEHGHYKFLPWTYPDYSWDENVKFLINMRNEIVRIG